MQTSLTEAALRPMLLIIFEAEASLHRALLELSRTKETLLSQMESSSSSSRPIEMPTLQHPSEQGSPLLGSKQISIDEQGTYWTSPFLS